MKKLIFFVILALVLMLWFFTVDSRAGTSYYVDCSLDDGGDDGAGSYADPWQSLTDLYQAGALSTGDDVYFKVGTTCTLAADADRIQIDWSGTSGDRVIIGCYDGDGDFDCGLTIYNSTNRPTIDGNSTYPGEYGFLIISDGYDYLTVKDLRLINSAGGGLSIGSGDYCIAENLITEDTYRQGIIFAKTTYGEIFNSYIKGTYAWTNVGDALELTGMSIEGASEYNHVHHNIVEDCNECIGLYKKVRYATVEYNIVRDNHTPAIYEDAGRYNTIRYNLIYRTIDGENTICSYCRGIVIDNEENRNYCYTGYSEVYGNLIAGQHHGVTVLNACGDNAGAEPYPNCDTSCNTTNLKIYSNTLVDNVTNIRVALDDAGWSNNEIKNNISYLITDVPSYHNSNDSPNGFTWDNNLFYPSSIDAVGGDANTGSNAVYNEDPNLSKKTDWRSLTIGSLDGSEFSTLVGGAGINEGTAIPTYNNRISASDFTATPITVSLTEDGTLPDIGAWLYGAGGESPIVYPLQGVSLTGAKVN